jgi:hypothetical protein
MRTDLVGETEEKRQIGKPRRRQRGNTSIKMGLREIGWEIVDWIHLAQDRNQRRAVVNTVINLRVL